MNVQRVAKQRQIVDQLGKQQTARSVSLYRIGELFQELFGHACLLLFDFALSLLTAIFDAPPPPWKYLVKGRGQPLHKYK